ncbi:MAG: EAL domain-containing protein, partial [Rickettsiales bacterium]
AYLTHSLPDRRSNDRRGYHYPPAFMKHLHSAIEHSNKTKESGTFMLVAINNLAMIINGYGFETSEQIMREIKQAISLKLNPYDKVERIHRDQLGVVLADCSKESAERQALEFKTIIQNLSSRTNIGPLHVTCAIGSVGFPESATTVAEALDKAYVALNGNRNMIYQAFENTKNDSEKSRQQMEMANYLHDAIKENRLRLAFQPIITAKSGEVAHYESLLRIVDDEGKITTAGPMIPVAEEMGLIEVIDRLVVEKVVDELRNHPDVSLAFNISSVTTGNPDWVRYLAKLLDDDLDVASRMVVEITETAAQRDLRETAYFVASVQALGCLVSLDDFGSGYTSFRQLKALSVDMLKIDGAFIRDLMDNADNRFFVKTLLDFTNGYGLKAVAEYVETGEVAKLLMELGVEYMQGYYFSQPLNHRPWLNEGEYTPS